MRSTMAKKNAKEKPKKKRSLPVKIIRILIKLGKTAVLVITVKNTVSSFAGRSGKKESAT